MRTTDWRISSFKAPAQLEQSGAERAQPRLRATRKSWWWAPALKRGSRGPKRTTLLQAWLHQTGAHSLALRGAQDAAAETIFQHLLHRIPNGDPFVLDVPEPNLADMALVRRHGMNEVFATARMYTGPWAFQKAPTGEAGLEVCLATGCQP